jgi:O-antigen/teichoic acid export membrane protein
MRMKTLVKEIVRKVQTQFQQLISGIFQTTTDAEASILAKFFLIIPVGIKPVLRRRYCAAAANSNLHSEAPFTEKSVRMLFLIQSLLCLYLLLHFNGLLQTVFHTRGEELLSFRVFTLLLPGLLFFSTILPQEPLYEASGEAARLRELSMRVAGINLALNFYLVPFAGLYGAATASTVSMGLYFLLFGHRNSQILKIQKSPLLMGSAAIYLTYLTVKHLGVGIFFQLWLTPALLAALMYAAGFFNSVTKSPIRIQREKQKEDLV